MLQKIYWRLVRARKADLVEVTKSDRWLKVMILYRFGAVAIVHVGGVHVPGVYYVEVTYDGVTSHLPENTNIALKIIADTSKTLATPKGRLLLLRLNPHDREHLVTTLREITAISSWLDTCA